MNNLLFFKKFSLLPESLKKEVEKFIDSLSKKKNLPSENKNHKPVFGSAKGMFKMSTDFDEPLDDFKEYMQ